MRDVSCIQANVIQHALLYWWQNILPLLSVGRAVCWLIWKQSNKTYRSATKRDGGLGVFAKGKERCTDVILDAPVPVI